MDDYRSQHGGYTTFEWRVRNTRDVPRRERRSHPPRNVGQYDERWWKWAGVPSGRAMLGSPLSRRHRGDAWRGVFFTGLLFLALMAAVAAIGWLIAQ